ncbi:MAG TPA: nitroreductase [Micromonosporaceae bacterium]|nr:nitroreductase [Micromonosporaceae bacterium]
MTAMAETVALAQAARMAGFAPSIHNTQPWRWEVEGRHLRLFAVRERQLPVTDPNGRLLIISCGAALHHARLALDAEGWRVQVERFPDESNRDLLARVTAIEKGPEEPTAIRHLQAMRIRQTDRRPVSGIMVDPDVLAALARIAQAEGARLEVLDADQVIELASAASLAAQVETLDPEWQDELAYWAGGDRRDGLGVPADVIPEAPPATTVPARDFGPGSLPVGPGHDRAARYAVLYGDEDSPLAWLRAGEALSALWLYATEHGVSIVPLSAIVEVPGTRRTIRHLLAEIGEPFLGLRIGIPNPEQHRPPHTPRLPAEQVVDIVG